MFLKQGNMFNIVKESDLFCITTNGKIGVRNNLIMGRGIAKGLRDLFPKIQYDAANNIRKFGNYIGSNVWEYGFLAFNNPYLDKPNEFGLFQTKLDWTGKSKIVYIKNAVDNLLLYLDRRPEIQKVDLNYPGIGNGGLTKKDVFPIISRLPDIVTIWYL